MLKNYLTIALRNLLRHKIYSAINIMGLTIGMACCILIIFYVQDEVGFDRYHDRSTRIYRLVDGNNAKTPAALGPAIKDAFPEVVDYVRMRPPFGFWMMRYEDKAFYEDLVYWTDETVFDIFSFELIQGDPETALKEPLTGIITRRIARKYFGDEDPMGKIIRADEQFDVKITGVIEDLPPDSHFQVDFMVSAVSTLQLWDWPALSDWFGNDWYTYVVLAPGTSPAQLQSKFPAFLDQHVDETQRTASGAFDIRPQALTDIHLYSHLENEAGANSDIVYIYLLTAIAAFIIVIAGINFMNLSTARSAGRAREVGLRKVVGAYRWHLILQFLGESILLSLCAVCLAVVLVYLALPGFNDLAGKQLDFQFGSIPVLSGLIAMALVVGLFAGSYPAFYLSSFQPVSVLKGQSKTGSGHNLLRKILVVFQFAISIVLIIDSNLLYEQFMFVQNKELGLKKEQVLVLTGGFNELYENHQSLKSALLQNPRIIQVAGIGSMPGRSGRKGRLPTISSRPLSGQVADKINIQYVNAGYDIIETLGFELAAGRGHARDFVSDREGAVFLNRIASERLGWASPEEAIGQELEIGDGKTRIIGVVEDFHMRSLHQSIQPLMIGLFPVESTYIGIRIHPEDIGSTIEFIEQTWRDILPAFPFAYTFLEEDFARLYQAEEKLGKVFNAFTVIAIFIACLGLFGLASFTAEQRTREIGVRKVLGASAPGIVLLLSKDFLKPILLANIIAWPLAYLVMERWLQKFAYRIDIPLNIFFLGGVLALIIALLTVSYQAIRAALLNPVEALRDE